VEFPDHRGFIAGCVVVIVAFIAWERRIDHPMLPLRFSPVAATAWPSPRCCSYSSPCWAVLSHDAVLTVRSRLQPLEAGVRIIPVAAVLLVVAPLSVWVARSVGTKYVCHDRARAGGHRLRDALAHDRRRNYRDTLAPFVMVGVGVALALAPCTESVMGSLPRSQAGVGSATSDTPCNWGRSGVGVLGTVLNLRYQNMMAPVVARAHVPMSVQKLIDGSLEGALAWPGALRRSWSRTRDIGASFLSSQGWTKRS